MSNRHSLRTNRLLGYLLLLCVASLGLLAPVAAADEPSERVDALALKVVEEGFSRDSSDIFGERWDSYLSTTSFVQTDVSIPGNGDLEMAVRRQLSAGGTGVTPQTPYRSGEFGGSPDPADSNNCFDGRRLVEPLHSGCASLRSWRKGQSRPRQLV